VAAMSVIVESYGDLYCPTCETSYREGTHCERDGTSLIRLSVVHDPNIGRELDGRFRVIERLGQGGMGVVYRAHQHSVDREVAVKVIHASRTMDPTVIKHFLREVKLTSRINHPNAVGVLDFGQTEDGLLYFAMELVPGRTLDRVIAEDGVLEPARVIKIGTQICEALEAAHALQILHRDLKPSNIMVLGRDFVKVLDFGLATTLEADDVMSSGANASIVGTPAFIAPERARDGANDVRSDLYSLGCLLYVLVCGHPPFRAASSSEVVAMHSSSMPARLASVPEALADVIHRLLAKDPAARYQSAGEARTALEQAAPARAASAAEPASATTETVARPSHVRRNVAIGLLLVAAVLVLVLGVGGKQTSTSAIPVPTDKLFGTSAPAADVEPPRVIDRPPAPSPEVAPEPSAPPRRPTTTRAHKPRLPF
jgi:eukaryotic-like serine/threonine-protein kinase